MSAQADVVQDSDLDAWAKRLRKRAKELAKQLDTGYVELSDLLYKVWDPPATGAGSKPLYQRWGHNSFAEYAEHELSLHRRKAERLRRIGYMLNVDLAGMDKILKSKLVGVGWSKLRELTRVLTLKNAAEWIEVADRVSYPVLMEEIAKYLQKKAEKDEKKAARKAVNASTPSSTPDDEASEDEKEDEDEEDDPILPPSEKYRLTNFLLFEEQYEIVRGALERAAELSQSSKKGHNLTMICTDFLATNDFKAGSDPKAVSRYLAKIEQLFGLKLIAVNPKSGDVMYGLQTLARAAKEVA